MQARLWMSNRCFENHVERIEPTTDGWIVKTKARRYFRFDAPSNDLLCKLMSLDELDDSDPSHATIINFLNVRLLPLGIYRVCDADANTGATTKHALSSTGTLRWQHQLLPARVVGKVAAALAPMFSPWALIPIMMLCLWIHASHIFYTAGLIGYRDCLTYSPNDLAVLVLVALGRGLLHEFGHAAACWRMTRSVGPIGFGVFIATPVLYCDVSDIHLLSRKKKALVGMAGTVTDLVFLAVLVGVAGSLPIIMKIYWLSLVAIVLNLVPFYRNDGYWVLNDLAGTTNLLAQSVNAWRIGKARLSEKALVAFTACCAAAVLGLATIFAFRLGPLQMAEAFKLLPDYAGWMLAVITTIQYAALVFGVLAVPKAALRCHLQ